MFKRLQELYQQANKNKLLKATATGAGIGAATLIASHSPLPIVGQAASGALTLHALGNAAAAGAATAFLNYIRNPQEPQKPAPDNTAPSA